MTPSPEPLYPEHPIAQDKLARDRISFKRCARCGENKPTAEFSPAGRGGLFSYCNPCRSAYNKAYGAIQEEKKKELRRIEIESLDPSLRPHPKICSNPECSLAGIIQTPENFHRSKIHRTGLIPDCIVCEKERKRRSTERHKGKDKKKKYNDDPESVAYYKRWHEEHKDELNKRTKEWRLAHPQEVRILHINRRFRQYGVDQFWYESTLAGQGGGCAICGSKDPKSNGGTFHVDHNHSCCNKGCHACDNCRRGLLCSVCSTWLGQLENIEWKRKAISYLNKYSKKPAIDLDQGSLFDFNTL